MKRPGIHDSSRSRRYNNAAPSGGGQDTSGFHPTIPIAFAYTGTFCVYLLGNLLPNLPQLSYPFSGCLLPVDDPPEASNSLTTQQIILASLFTFHFCRRALETIFVHRYKRTNSLFEIIGAHIYYWFFAFWAGWSVRADMRYHPTHNQLFVAGIILFWIGEAGNCAAHLRLRDIRKEKSSLKSAPSGRVIPGGKMFALVSCPHYSAEILSWLGFAMASMVMASVGLLAATVLVLVIMSMEHHQRYLKDFDGKDGRELYPRNRKALIPYIY